MQFACIVINTEFVVPSDKVKLFALLCDVLLKTRNKNARCHLMGFSSFADPISLYHSLPRPNGGWMELKVPRPYGMVGYVAADATAKHKLNN